MAVCVGSRPWVWSRLTREGSLCDDGGAKLGRLGGVRARAGGGEAAGAGAGTRGRGEGAST